WVVLVHVRAFLLEQTDHIQRGRFVPVVYIGLVRRAADETLRAFQGVASLAERIDDALDHVAWHVRINLGRQLDEARVVIERLHLPRKIQRIDRDAMTSQARTWRELHEAERLGRGGVYHLPHTHAETFTHHR